MRTFWGVLIASAALTLICSPSARNGLLQSLFDRDVPETPADWHPTYRVFHGGVGVDVESFPEVPDAVIHNPDAPMARAQDDTQGDLAAA